MANIADFIVMNAHVFTADEGLPEARAVAVKGKNIVFVGDELGAKEWKGSSTRLIDGASCTLMPGIIDSHFHMQHGSLGLDRIHFETCTTYEQAAQVIRDRRHPILSWEISEFARRLLMLSITRP